jgi:hypothetical protein
MMKAPIREDTEQEGVDITEQFPGCVKAEQRDRDVIIVRRLDHLHQRVDGRRVRFEIEWRWLTKPTDVHSVKGNEFTYWGYRDLRLIRRASLFHIFQLFP